MAQLSGIMGEFVGNNQVVVQALQRRIIGTFWSILASTSDLRFNVPDIHTYIRT